MTFNPNQVMNYQSVYTENPGEQITSTTLQVVSGSEITYEPFINTDYVIYEINFTQDYYNDLDIINNYYLESGSLGGTFGEVEGCTNNFQSTNASVPKDMKSLMFIIPSWVGKKRLRLTVDAYGNDYQTRLHRTATWEGATNTSKVNSVNLEVFSVRNQ